MGRKNKKSDEEVQKIYDEINRISQEYNIPQAVLKSIVREYGDLDNFKKQYINYALGKLNIEKKDILEKHLKNLRGKYIRVFDLNSPDLIFKETGYCKINQIPIFSILLDGQDLIEKTDKNLEKIPEKWAELLKIHYGLKMERLNFNEIAKSSNVSRQNISEKFGYAKREYDNNNIIEQVNMIQDVDKKENFIKTFFSNNDMFYNEIISKNSKKNEYQIFLNSMIVQAFDMKSSTYIKDKEQNEECGVEKIIERINKLKNNINILMENLYIDKSQIKISVEQRLLKDLEELENKMNKYIIQEEYLSNDYLELVEILKQINEIEKETQVIEIFDFSTRTYNALKRGGINTLHNLVSKNESELINIKGLGKEKIQEIKDIIHENGFLLKDEDGNIDADLADEIKELQIRYEALKIKTVESERLKKRLLSEIKQLNNYNKNSANILLNFDNWILENKEYIKKDETRKNILKLRDEIQHQIYKKKSKEMKCSSELMYVEKRIGDFKKQKIETYNTMTEIEI